MTYLARGVEVAKDFAGDLHEDDLVGDAGGEEVVRATFIFIHFKASLYEEEGLSLNGFGVGRHRGHNDHVSARHGDEEEFTSSFEVFHGGPIPIKRG
jgi:hypothetical protein